MDFAYPTPKHKWNFFYLTGQRRTKLHLPLRSECIMTVVCFIRMTKLWPAPAGCRFTDSPLTFRTATCPSSLFCTLVSPALIIFNYFIAATTRSITQTELLNKIHYLTVVLTVLSHPDFRWRIRYWIYKKEHNTDWLVSSHNEEPIWVAVREPVSHQKNFRLLWLQANCSCFHSKFFILFTFLIEMSTNIMFVYFTFFIAELRHE